MTYMMPIFLVLQRRVFGHWGAGGQVTYCDPVCGLGWAYITNYSNILHGFIVDHRYSALESAMYECVAELRKSQ
jgi:CubicO group peptidase (beta-lactamase class C family)